MSPKAAFNATKFKIVSIATIFCFVGAFAGYISAQNLPSQATTKPVAASDKSATTKKTIDTWDKLSPSQQTALQPLYANWKDLSDGHKRKWLAVSVNFDRFSPQDKAKLHSRMTDWANLSAKQRTVARINFAQSQTLTAKDKQAKWETYKALPPETKQALAEIDLAPKPTGAAVAVKPVIKNKQTPEVSKKPRVETTVKTDKNTTQ